MVAKEAARIAQKLTEAKGTKQIERNVRAQLTRELSGSKALTGRPPSVIDVAQLKKMARIHCTYKEMADVLECSTLTLRRRYGGLIKKMRSHGKRSLRRSQFKSAIEKNNPIMQIWLGKNVLKQADKVEHSGPKGGPIKVQNATVLLIGKLDQIEKRKDQAAMLEAGDEVEDADFEVAS